MSTKTISIPGSFLPFLACFCSCAEHNDPGKKDAAGVVDTITRKVNDTSPVSKAPQTLFDNFDTTMTLFSDGSYKTSLHVDGLPEKYEYEERYKNALLKLYIDKPGKSEILLVDSLHCRMPTLAFDDYNNDGVNDLLIYHASGARSNTTRYLYLVDAKNKRLAMVKGFEQIPNASLDTADNVITSLNLSGTNTYSFYNIDSRGKLVDLGHGFDAGAGDSGQIKKAMSKIYKEHKGTVKPR